MVWSVVTAFSCLKTLAQVRMLLCYLFIAKVQPYLLWSLGFVWTLVRFPKVIRSKAKFPVLNLSYVAETITLGSNPLRWFLWYCSLSKGPDSKLKSCLSTSTTVHHVSYTNLFDTSLLASRTLILHQVIEAMFPSWLKLWLLKDLVPDVDLRIWQKVMNVKCQTQIKRWSCSLCWCAQSKWQKSPASLATFANALDTIANNCYALWPSDLRTVPKFNLPCRTAQKLNCKLGLLWLNSIFFKLKCKATWASGESITQSSAATSGSSRLGGRDDPFWLMVPELQVAFC